MVAVYGFSDKLGPISFEDAGHSIFIGRDFGTTKSYSEETAAIIDEEVKRIFDEAGKKCEEILVEHRDLLVKVAEYLLVNESMDGEDFAFLCEHGYVPEKVKSPENEEVSAGEIKSESFYTNDTANTEYKQVNPNGDEYK